MEKGRDLPSAGGYNLEMLGHKRLLQHRTGLAKPLSIPSTEESETQWPRCKTNLDIH